VPCITPYGLSSTGITGTTAFVTWSPLVTADSFMVRYSVNGTEDYHWKKISGEYGASSAQITGLSFNTQYQAQVRSICAGVTTSVYSQAEVFVTGNFKLFSEESETELIQVFPLPANDLLNIRFHSGINGDGLLSLTDATGRNIHSYFFRVMEGENFIQTDVSMIAEGIYFLNLESGDTCYYKTIVKTLK
jgi:hypothetical protein